MMQAKKIAVCLSAAAVLAVAPMPAEASFSDMIEMGWQAAKGAVQEDDEKIAKEIAEIVLSNPTERERLREYVMQTRAVISNETSYFKDTVLSGIMLARKIPFGDDAIFEGYVWKYENALEKDANTNVLKRFAELRGHAVDACSDIADLFISTAIEHEEDGVGTAGIVMKMANYKQMRSRYESAANAIGFVLAAAGMEMEPVDDGNIFGFDNHPRVNQPPLSIFEENSEEAAETEGNYVEAAKEQPEPAAEWSEAENTAEDLALHNIAIGDSVDAIFQRMGASQRREKKNNRTIYYYPAVEIYSENGQVTALVSNSPAAETPKGIHEGSLLQEVLSAYGNDYMKSQYDNLELYEYENTGRNGRSVIMRFAINSSGCVDYISIRQR